MTHQLMTLSLPYGDPYALYRAFGPVVDVDGATLGAVYRWAVAWLPADAFCEVVVQAVRERAHALGDTVEDDLNTRYALQALSSGAVSTSPSWVGARIARCMQARGEALPTYNAVLEGPQPEPDTPERFWWAVLIALDGFRDRPLHPCDNLAIALSLLLGSEESVRRVVDALSSYGAWCPGSWEKN